MKQFFSCALLVILVLSLVGCNSDDELLTWAKNLRVEDIAAIEAIAMPSTENQRYKYYDASEYKRIVEIINGAKGKKVDNAESIVGGGITFYITTSDGEQYKFSNNGNVYLVIGESSYEANRDWLSSWGDEILNSKMPNDFVY